MVTPLLPIQTNDRCKIAGEINYYLDKSPTFTVLSGVVASL